MSTGIIFFCAAVTAYAIGTSIKYYFEERNFRRNLKRGQMVLIEYQRGMAYGTYVAPKGTQHVIKLYTNCFINVPSNKIYKP